MARTDVTWQGFDYSQLPEDLSSKLIYRAGEIKKCSTLLIERIVEIGRELAEAHEDLVGVGCEGLFRPWLEAETRYSKATAYQYMRAFRYCKKYLTHAPQSSDKCPAPGHLDHRLGGMGNSSDAGHFQAEALYLLGTDELPEAAGKAAAKLAENGVYVRKETAQGLIKKHTEPVPAEPPDDESTDLEDEPTDPDYVDIPPALTPEECMKEDAKEIESFARSISAKIKDAPDSPWLDETQIEIIGDQLKSAARTVRQAKGHAICPKCQGTGCDKCRHAGWLNKQDYEATAK